MSDMRDKLWLLGETPGSHHKVKGYNMPGENKMTPVEGLEHFGIGNLCRMKMRSDMGMSFLDDPYIVGDAIEKLSLTLVGSCAWRPDPGTRDDMDQILAIAKKDKRLVSAINDDFFNEARMAIYTPEVLREQRETLHTALERPIDFWSVVYEHSLLRDQDIYAHAKEYDLTTFWVWYSENIPDMQKYLDWAKTLTKDGRIILGIYMYDYGNCCPLSDDLMKMQLDFAYEKMVSGEIEGAMLHSSCNMDLGLSSTEITKKWVEDIIK